MPINKSYIGILSSNVLKLILIHGWWMKGRLISQLRKAAKDRKTFLLYCWYLILSGVYQQSLLASATRELL